MDAPQLCGYYDILSIYVNRGAGKVLFLKTAEVQIDHSSVDYPQIYPVKVPI